MEDFPFLLVDETEGFEAYEGDGILGLCKNNPVGSNDSLFTHSLFNQGVIKEPIFSIELGHEHEESWIRFGEHEGKEKEFTWIDTH